MLVFVDQEMQLGTPITITIGGISAVSTVISNPKRPKIPKAHITPMTTHHHGDKSGAIGFEKEKENQGRDQCGYDDKTCESRSGWYRR
jgi:hypothetical protein